MRTKHIPRNATYTHQGRSRISKIKNKELISYRNLDHLSAVLTSQQITSAVDALLHNTPLWKVENRRPSNDLNPATPDFEPEPRKLKTNNDTTQKSRQGSEIQMQETLASRMRKKSTSSQSYEDNANGDKSAVPFTTGKSPPGLKHDISPNMRASTPKQQKNNERGGVRNIPENLQQPRSPTMYANHIAYLGEADNSIDDLTQLSPRDSIYMSFPELSNEFVQALYAVCPNTSTLYKFLTTPETLLIPQPKKVCRYFLEGGCYRADCKFSHEMSKEICTYWKKGICAKGDGQCDYYHGLSEILIEQIRHIGSEDTKEEPEIISRSSDEPIEDPSDAFPSLIAAAPSSITKDTSKMKPGWKIRDSSSPSDTSSRGGSPPSAGIWPVKSALSKGKS